MSASRPKNDRSVVLAVKGVRGKEDVSPPRHNAQFLSSFLQRKYQNHLLSSLISLRMTSSLAFAVAFALLKHSSESGVFVTKFKNAFSLVLFSVLAAISLCALPARASVAEKIEQVCGLSDTIYDYIAKTAGEKAKSNFALTATLGSARRMIMYNDGSWILTLEFLSAGAIENDKTCIIAKGELANQELATDIMKKTPWIGPMETPQKAPTKTAPPPDPKRSWMNEA